MCLYPIVHRVNLHPVALTLNVQKEMELAHVNALSPTSATRTKVVDLSV